MRALFSVMDKTKAVATLAEGLSDAGWELISSTGTKKFLESQGLKVTDTSEITGLKPVLDHRVATLCPQLHGGLLAEVKHLEELASLGWPIIDMVVVTFYPLQEKMRDHSLTDKQLNEFVDIGGPTLVSSACKGGRIVLTDERDFEWVLSVIQKQHGGCPCSDMIWWLHAVAVTKIAEYRASEALFRIRRLRPAIVGC